MVRLGDGDHEVDVDVVDWGSLNAGGGGGGVCEDVCISLVEAGGGGGASLEVGSDSIPELVPHTQLEP